MKKYIYTMVLGLILSACTNKQEKATVISVLEDVTETNFVQQPNPKVISSLFGFDTNLWRSVTFRYSRITSLMLNSRDVISINAEHYLFGNELERRQLVTDFNKKATALLEQPKDSTAFSHSSIWSPLVEELEDLQKDADANTTLYLYTDLRENSAWFSTYRASDMKKLLGHQDAVIELFLSKATGVSASDNIKIIVVYQPQSIDDDMLFRQLRTLYSELFLSIGIQIEFTANLSP